MTDRSCSECCKELDDHTCYEYRGALFCADCFDIGCTVRDRQRQHVMQIEDAKTAPLRGLDLGDSIIGKANRKLLKRRIAVAGRESEQLKRYEQEGKLDAN